MSSTEFTASKLAFFDALSADPEMTPLDVRVAWRILHHVNERYGYSWPSVERLAGEACCSERSVQYAIRRLVQKGWFEIVPGSGGGRKQTNRYVPRLAQGKRGENGAADCTFTKKAYAEIPSNRVQIPAQTVQISVENDAPGCTQILYEKSLPQSFRPQGARSSTSDASHKYARSKKDVAPSVRSTLSRESQGGAAAIKKTVWHSLPRAIAPRNLQGEIVERLIEGLNLTRGNAWGILMHLPADALAVLEQRQSANSLQDVDLVEVIQTVKGQGA